MQIKQLLRDDDAVSPVIGVILMVAITVILAAVIASFVLGLGPGESAPTAQFDVEYNGDFSGGDGIINVTHATGATINPANLEVQFGDLDTVSFEAGDIWGSTPSGGASYAKVEGNDVSTGDSVGYVLGSSPDEVEVSIVWIGDGSTSTIDRSTVTIN